MLRTIQLKLAQNNIFKKPIKFICTAAAIISLLFGGMQLYFFFYQDHQDHPLVYVESIKISQVDWRSSLLGSENKTKVSLTQLYRLCLLEKLRNKSKWNELIASIRVCLGETVWNQLDVKILENLHDIKFAILPAESARNDFDCVQVTLGIGKDIEAEKQLRSYLPQYRFFGADPILSSGQIFNELGTYFEFAVGPKAGKTQASVCIDDVYVDKVVETVALTDFVKNHAKIDHIDYFIVDNEGPEYGIFKQLQPGGVLENFTICQISFEMHGLLTSWNMSETEYNQLIDSTIRRSAFLPFFSGKLIVPSLNVEHMRTFFLNVRSDYCNRMYYAGKFLNWS